MQINKHTCDGGELVCHIHVFEGDGHKRRPDYIPADYYEPTLFSNLYYYKDDHSEDSKNDRIKQKVIIQEKKKALN